MGRAEQIRKREQELSSLEKEFRDLLITALKKCDDGGSGVFLLSQKAEKLGLNWLVWPVTRELEAIGERIRELRISLVMPLEESLYEVFLKYCNINGPNAPGGAKRAAALLKEIGA
jgi:hypothetical protein